MASKVQFAAAEVKIRPATLKANALLHILATVLVVQLEMIQNARVAMIQLNNV